VARRGDESAVLSLGDGEFWYGRADGSLIATLGALAVAFPLVTPLAGTLLGLDWTQAVLLGGFAGAAAVASARVTARRGAGDADPASRD
jgi:hypothetical protein